LKAVLDENAPRALVAVLRGFDCSISPFPNAWKGLKNGRLLERLEIDGFDRLLTCDKNIEWQQPLRNRKVAVVVLPVQDIKTLSAGAERIALALKSAKPGAATQVHLDIDLR